MRNYLVLALAAFSLATGGWTTSMLGNQTFTGDVYFGGCAYQTFEATGGACRSLGAGQAVVALNADVAGQTKTGVTGEVWSCPTDLSGSLAINKNICELNYYKDKDGTVQTQLTGNPADGRDRLLEVNGPIICVEATTVPRKIAFSICGY